MGQFCTCLKYQLYVLINAVFISLFLLEEDTQQQEWCLKVEEGIKRGQRRKITSGEWMLGSRGGAYLTLENQDGRDLDVSTKQQTACCSRNSSSPWELTPSQRP